MVSGFITASELDVSSSNLTGREDLRLVFYTKQMIIII